MRRRRVAVAILMALAGADAARAQDTHLLIVAGLGGEPEYAESFRSWSRALHASAEKRLGISRANLTYLTEDPERDPGRVDGKSTRDELAAAFTRIAGRVRPGDTLGVILFGHGSGAGDEARFNLPGPDASARDFSTWLVPFALQRVVFVNAASASGDFQKVLAGKNRVILTATKSSQERNESIFGRYFSEALSGDGADVDKDGSVSILEAFESTRAQVATEYQRERRLLTEHAVLEDGAGGLVAKATFLGSKARSGDDPSAVADDPGLGPLVAERRTLEDAIERLKAGKATMASDRYDLELERLLLALALKNDEIRLKKGAPKK